MKLQTLGLFVLSILFIGSCSNSSSISTPLADSIGLIKAGVNATGTGLESTRSSKANRPTVAFTSTLCNENGMPQIPEAEPDGSDLSCPRCMDQSDGRYPFIHTYCAMTGTDGDTVGGGFALAQSLICSLEKGGITFTGTTQQIPIVFTDTDCWPNGVPGGRDSVTITAKGTAPAEFNTHYEKGVDFTVSVGGDLRFRLAANVDGDKVEFIGHELWTDTLQTGVMAGEITKSTGVLKFEKRDERILNPANTKDMGWNRHTRLIATLTMSDGVPNGLTSFEYGYANTQDDGQQTPSARVITAKGSPAETIKARIFETAGVASFIKNVSNWSAAEVANSFCANDYGISDTGTLSCASQSGIGVFNTDTRFLLYDTGTPAHLTPLEWLTAFGGFLPSSTTVDLDEDVAFTPNS